MSVQDQDCILVVEDDEITRKLLTALLVAGGYRVCAAGDGMSAVVAAKSEKPDLAILDLHLPDISGIDLAGLLQPQIPFLVLTVDETPEALQRCAVKGALGYLVKPLAAEEFLRHVHVALERGREQRNLRRALNDNPVINKALGILMGHFKFSEQQALEALIHHATSHNMKAVELAQRIVDAIVCIQTVTVKGFKADPRLQKIQKDAELFLDQFRSAA